MSVEVDSRTALSGMGSLGICAQSSSSSSSRGTKWQSCWATFDHNLKNLDAMENSSTVPTSQDAASQLMSFLKERLDEMEKNFEEKLNASEDSNKAILKKLNKFEGKINNMFTRRVASRTPFRYACFPSNSQVPITKTDKEAILQGTIKDILKPGDPKYKTSVLIWTDSEAQIESVNVDALPNPVLPATMVDCSVASALKCCGIEDAEVSAQSESSGNPFTVFAGKVKGEEMVQNGLQAKWKRSNSCPLLAACDGRKPGTVPIFTPHGPSKSFELTAKPDIVSRACPMVMEFTLARSDRKLKDGLQQVLERLHLLLSVNCFIKRAFGFAVNGGTSSFLVSIRRKLVRDQPHWYEDTVHIRKIATTHVAGIWNELTKKAQRDLCFVLHRDVFALAATLRAMSQATPQSASPPPTPDWDLSRLVGYAKIGLRGLSSSRVYGVYPSSVITEEKSRFIRTPNDKPAFVVKINDSPARSCREHSALKRLAEYFVLSPPLAQLFYVHQSFVLKNWVASDSDTATFSSVAVDGYSRTLREAFSLRDQLAGLCLDTQDAIQDTCWWHPLFHRSLPNETSTCEKATVATVVMKEARRLKSVESTARIDVEDCLVRWLSHIHKAGVLHTDLRSSNIMWLPVQSGSVTKDLENSFTLPVDDVLADAVSPNNEDSEVRLLASQFHMLHIAKTQHKEVRSCSENDVDDVPGETTEKANATGGPEATATTEADEATAKAKGAIAATAATAIDHSVNDQEVMLPIIVDFDCAELLSAGADSCVVDITIPGARSNLIRKLTKRMQPSNEVQWKTNDDSIMVKSSLAALVPK